MDQRAFGAVTAVAGCLMAALAFLPWFDFRSFSISGVDLPGQEGEFLLVTGLLIAGTGIGAVRRAGPLPLLLAGLLGLVGFVIATRQIFTYWQAGSCGAFTGAAPGGDFICREYSDIIWNVSGSPTPMLWATAGLSAFVSLLAGWRFFSRPSRSENGSPPNASGAWA